MFIQFPLSYWVHLMEISGIRPTIIVMRRNNEALLKAGTRYKIYFHLLQNSFLSVTLKCGLNYINFSSFWAG